MTTSRTPATPPGRQQPEVGARERSVAPSPVPGLDPSHPLSVSRVARRLAEIIDARIRRVHTLWIEGEIGDTRLNARGTLRFTLSDGQSRMECVWWSPTRDAARGLVDGMQVVVAARPKVFTRVVGLVCVVTEVRLSGASAGMAAREQVRARLSAEGLFEPTRKRCLPHLPRVVAVITGRSSAAWHDVLAIAGRRHAGIPIVLVPAQMQGDAAPDSVRSALRAVAASRMFDVVIITRGGGPAADLVAFDDESLARDIAACPIPVVTAIGHEVDFSIADAVADCREPTPSAAAARVIPDRNELTTRVRDSRAAMDDALVRQLECQAVRLRVARGAIGSATLVQLGAARRRLDRAGGDLEFGLKRRLERACTRVGQVAVVMRHAVPRLLATARPRLRASDRELRHAMAQLTSSGQDRSRLISQQLAHAMTASVARQAARQERTAAQLAALDPLAVLRRGYAIVRTAADSVITSAHDVSSDAPLLVQFHDGVVAVRALAQDPLRPFTQGAES